MTTSATEGKGTLGTPKTPQTARTPHASRTTRAPRRPRRGAVTAQRLDPLGIYSVRILMPVTAVVAVVYAAISTAWHADQIGSWPLAWLALALIAAASAVLVWAARTRRSPFAAGAFVAMVALALLGSLSFTAAVWGNNLRIQDDWGQVSVAVLLLSTGQLRPTRDLVIAGLGSAVVLGVAAAVQAPMLAVPAEVGVYAVVAAAPPLALAFGTAAYARHLLIAAERWQARARTGMARLEPQIREGVERSVQQEFVTTLNQAAAPLLERLLASAEITPADSAAASAIGRDLRERAVGTMEQSWLHNTLERARTLGPTPLHARVAPGLVDAVTADQRAVFGSLLFTLLSTADATTFSLARVEIRATRLSSDGAKLNLATDIAAATQPAGARAATAQAGTRTVAAQTADTQTAAETQPGTRARPAAPERACLELAATATAERTAREVQAIRRQLMSYLSVLRVTSRNAKLKVTAKAIEVEFCYDLD